MQIAIILGGEFRLAIVGRRAAREYALAKLARARDDSGLFVVEPERGGVEDRHVQPVTSIAATLLFAGTVIMASLRLQPRGLSGRNSARH